jgi:hypothetical protein
MTYLFDDLFVQEDDKEDDEEPDDQEADDEKADDEVISPAPCRLFWIFCFISAKLN